MLFRRLLLLCLFVSSLFVPRALFADGASKHGSSPPDGLSRFRLGPALSILEGLKDGGFGWGTSVGFAFRMGPDSPVFLGMDIGYHRWNVDVETTASGATTPTKTSETLSSVQILASIYYRFMEGSRTSAHPYIGLSIGPALLNGNEKIQVGGKNITGGGTGVAFQLLFRPGVEIDLSRNIGITVEPAMGLLEGSMIFVPQLNAVFSF